MSNSIGLYIHIPFCRHKCPYCDFYSSSADENTYDEYVSELKDKINYWSAIADRKLSTVYFGGGTPSVLGADRLCDILNTISSCFDIEKNAEITLEVNPDSAKTINFEKLYKSGFNRISMGMQSAVKSELKSLGRIHSADDAKLSVNRAHNAGFKNISLDLMMGIPNQTIESLEQSIRFCAECGVTHISSYILKIEENTPFYKMKNKLELADDDMQAEMYLRAVNLLDELGYKQYEISNFAKSGFESRHNTNYWKCGEYIGIGPSAHSFFEGKRFYYSRSMDKFKENIIFDDGTGGDEEEFIMLSLRLAKGLNFKEYENKFAAPLPDSVILKAKQYEKYGLTKVDEKSIRFTPRGFLVSNSIISELI